MSQHSPQTGTANLGGVRNLIRTAVIAIGVTVAVTWLAMGDRAAMFLRHVSELNWAPHLPDLSLLARASLAIQIHVAAVTVALVIGGAVLTGIKGDTKHRVLGWTWVVAMAAAAISSLFISSIRPGHFSFLHLFAGWTLVALPFAVAMARKHKVRIHGRMMTGLFVGGLVIAGITAFLPGRLMWAVVFG
ncbi:DUF2306 domain-containing protein [Caulobacter segnis]|uniref:DUF2306 domain-containing protein n=1 Tax=Caulobacter segnis TaxID=88688 RepID=UPI00240FCC41|nr:DUF2306 domain-containing protein [Caulobacter segnis]MDG2521072.1 DUF2306 domain-containing protein [Caulobacter segnis]